MKSIKLVLADVDGTLVTRAKLLTEGTRPAVRKLGETGAAFAITSGWPPRGMEMLRVRRFFINASLGVSRVRMDANVRGSGGSAGELPDVRSSRRQAV